MCRTISIWYLSWPLLQEELLLQWLPYQWEASWNPIDFHLLFSVISLAMETCKGNSPLLVPLWRMFPMSHLSQEPPTKSGLSLPFLTPVGWMKPLVLLTFSIFLHHVSSSWRIGTWPKNKMWTMGSSKVIDTLLVSTKPYSNFRWIICTLVSLSIFSVLNGSISLICSISDKRWIPKISQQLLGTQIRKQRKSMCPQKCEDRQR